jgi:hypothetical protein
MTMKTTLIVAFGIASTVACLPATAQTYQWKDSSGRTVISDTPPPKSVKQPRALGSPAPAASEEQAATGSKAEAPKTYAEKELEFKKRQQENREKAEKQAKEDSATAERRENCERAKRQLSLLESGERISAPDERGERRFLEDAERQREIERTRKYVADTCK